MTLRAVTGLVGRGGGNPFFRGADAARRQPRRCTTTAAAAAGSGGSAGPAAASGNSRAAGSAAGSGSRFGWTKWALIPSAAAALLGGVSNAFATTDAQQQLAAGQQRAASSLKAAEDWIHEIEQQPGMVKAFDAEMLMEAEHEVLEDDHMFSAFVAKGLVNDLTGYYDPQQRKFYSIISLGREVCGFPRIVHGGLTAAIIDESFGGLLFALKRAKALSFWGPAYTVALEIQYKSKISAGRTVLCTTEVESMEGRKVWMRATVSDGPHGTVYATARALFVAPKPLKMVQDVGKYLLRRMFGDG